MSGDSIVNRISKPTVLLIIGNGKKRFYEAMIKNKGIDNIELIEVNNEDELGGVIKSILKRSGAEGIENVGIAAGASTPESITQAVFNQIRNYS